MKHTADMQRDRSKDWQEMLEHCEQLGARDGMQAVSKHFMKHRHAFDRCRERQAVEQETNRTHEHQIDQWADKLAQEMQSAMHDHGWDR